MTSLRTSVSLIYMMPAAPACVMEKRMSSYAFWLRALMWSLRIALAAGVYGIHVAGMEVDRPVLVVAAILCILSAGAYLLGNSATSRLQGAFEQQRSKAR